MKIAVQTVLASVLGLAFFGLALFVPAGTLNYASAGVTAVALAARILDEEQLLAAELTGYREYMQQVRYRVVPHVW